MTYDIQSTEKYKDFPLVSVIIPVYNVEKYLRQCLSSVVKQSYSNLEIIVVDDGATDRSAIICDEYAEKYDKITVIHQRNMGLSVARNTALDICNGDIIAFVDSDDWWENDAVATAVNRMLGDKLDVVFFAANRVFADRSVVDFVEFDDHTVKTFDEMAHMCLKDEIGGQVWRKFYASSCWKKVRFPIGRTYEDLAVSHLVYLNSGSISQHGRVGFITKPLYNYRMNEEGISLIKKNNAQRNFDIFLGFVDHFNFILEHIDEYYECLETVLKKTVERGFSAYGSIVAGKKDMQVQKNNIESFFLENKKLLLGDKNLPTKDYLKLCTFYISPKIYEWLLRICYKSRSIK